MNVKVAIVQAPPVLLHRDATMEQALDHAFAARASSVASNSLYRLRCSGGGGRR
jgi:hypothetical protein